MNETDAQLFARLRETADANLSREPRRRRVNAWEARLVDFLIARATTPFKWGASDCCLFACDAINAISGEDPAAWFRGRYDDHRGAVLALREFSDGGDLEAVAEKIALEQGFDEIPPAFMQRGDCVLIETDAGKALGVVADYRVAAQGPAGLVLGNELRILRSWAV